MSGDKCRDIALARAGKTFYTSLISLVQSVNECVNGKHKSHVQNIIEMQNAICWQMRNRLQHKVK